MPDSSTLGDRIRQARSQIGYEPADLARELGLKSTVQISLWETGKRKPGARRLGEIATALRVSADWLLHGSDNGLGPSVARSGDFKAVARSSNVVREWTLDYRAELARMLGDEDREEEAFQATIDLAGRMYAEGGAHKDWSVADSLRVLKSARRRMRRILGFEK